MVTLAKKMKTLSIFIIIAALLGGCVSTAPLENAPFSNVSSIDELVGRYSNEGDGGPEAQSSLYLSRILWPKDKSIVHERIEFINVEKASEDSLVVNGLGGGKLIKKSIFTLGVNFEIDNGVIILSSEVGIAGLKSGEPMVGVYAGGSKIGLDVNGHGKFHSSGTAAGLVFLFLPMAVGGSQDVRFNRIE